MMIIVADIYQARNKVNVRGDIAYAAILNSAFGAIGLRPLSSLLSSASDEIVWWGMNLRNFFSLNVHSLIFILLVYKPS